MKFGSLYALTRSVGVKLATNLALWSQDFTNVYWTKNRVTLTTGVTAPDGTLTAFKMVEIANASATFGVAKLAAVITPGGPGVYSVYVQPVERTACYIAINNAGANQRAFFDLATGTVVGTPDLCTAGIEAVFGAPGWFRIWLTSSVIVDGWAKFYMSNAPGISTYTSAGGLGMNIWGADIKAESGLTTYIPTTSAPVAGNVSRLISVTYGDPVITSISLFENRK